MNYYSVLSLLLIGLIFFYVKIGWLGLIFILLAIIAGIYSPVRKGADTTWNELSKAQGSYPSGKFKEYSENAIKLSMDIATKKETDGLNTKEWISKAPTASKSFFSELKDLFK